MITVLRADANNMASTRKNNKADDGYQTPKRSILLMILPRYREEKETTVNCYLCSPNKSKKSQKNAIKLT